MKKLRRSSQVRMELRFLLAESEIVTLKKAVEIQALSRAPTMTMVPPYSSDGGESSVASAGHSNINDSEVRSTMRYDDDEELPPYEEAVASRGFD